MEMSNWENRSVGTTQARTSEALCFPQGTPGAGSCQEEVELQGHGAVCQVKEDEPRAGSAAGSREHRGAAQPRCA